MYSTIYKMIKVRLAILFAIIVSIGLLAGCSPEPKLCSSQKLSNLQNKIFVQGGQWLEYGDKVAITMPTSQVFYTNSLNMTPEAEQLFDTIAERLTCYSTQSVEVAAYAGGFNQAESNQALARERAQIIANLLQEHKVSRLIYAKSKAILSCSYYCRQNRIEIVTNRLD